ncbi:MAG: FtsQ-type POTRA domain-containing protein [Smithella sp.]|nr:FtsQ-type POTRA domain-containing protein [Smithella sp.]
MFRKIIRKKSEIEKKQNRMRRRLSNVSGDFFAAGVLLSVAAGLTIAFIYTYSLIISSPYFQIQEVSVRGLKELTEKDILALANIKPMQNILAVNTEAVARRVSANQWVEHVYVGRELPGKLVLEVQERTPLALVKQSDDFYLMDAKGFVFKRLMKNDAVDLPIITGVRKEEKTASPLILYTLTFLQTVSRSEEYAYLGTIAEINVDDVFGVALIFDKGLYLKLGTDGFEAKLKKLKNVLADLESRGMKTGYVCVDLSDESKVTIKRKNIPERMAQDDKSKQYQI